MNRPLENNNSFLGYTDNKTALQKGKIEKCLSKAFRYDGIVMQRRDAMIVDLRNGKIPAIVETTVNGRNKKSYRLNFEIDGTKVFNEITKTEYDFCLYLIKNELVSEESVNAYIQDENRIREVEAENEKQEEEAAIREEERAQEEREKFAEWAKNAAKEYEGTPKGNLMEKIFVDKSGSFYNHERAFVLLACIDNIDNNPLCKEELKERLYTGNKASRKTFECVTGLKLPKNNRDTAEFIDNLQKSDYCNKVDYKVKDKTEVKANNESELKEFYILEVDNEHKRKEYKKVFGEKIIKKGFACFIHELKDKTYAVSSVECGVRLATGKTKAEAVKNLKREISRFGDVELRQKLQEIVNLYGASPLYNLQ